MCVCEYEIISNAKKKGQMTLTIDIEIGFYKLQ